MSDLISKSKLIEEILEEANTKILDLESGITLGEMKEWVENQPAVESATWVPCSEKLPEKPKENPVFDYKNVELYLVSVKNADYPFRAFWNGKFFADGFSKVENVIAWMPLPPAFKGE